MRERAADRGSWEAKAASNYRMPTPHGLHSSGQPSPLPKRPGPCLSLLACALEDAGHHETRFWPALPPRMGVSQPFVPL